MRSCLVLLVGALLAIGGCRDRPAPAAGRDAAPVVVAPRIDGGAPTPAARTGHVDGFGAGRVILGAEASALIALGFVGDEPVGTVAASQDGTPLPGTMRLGSQLRLVQDGVEQIVVEVEPARMRVDAIAIVGPHPRTREGIGVGSRLDQVEAAYGAPERLALPCRQYARLPGVELCASADDTIVRMRIPAPRPSPLAFGEDLTAIAAALEGHVVAGGVYRDGRLMPVTAGNPILTATLVAPCVLAVGDDRSMGYHAAMVHDGVVYDSPGGWRRADGSTLICAGSSIYELAADGTGTRWRGESFDGNWRAEPADCTSGARRVTCRGVTEMSHGFEGSWLGDLVLPDHLADEPGAARAVRADGSSTDDCDRLAEQAWRTLSPTLTYLGLPTDDAARLAYLLDEPADYFRGECAAATADQRRCLLRSPDLLRERDCTLTAPGLDWRPHVAVIARPAPLSAAERRRRDRALVGTWRRVHEHHDDAIWTFDRKGRLSVNGQPRGHYRSVRPGEIVVETSSSSTGYWLARDGKTRLFINDPGITCPVDRTFAHVDLGLASQDVLLIRGSTCKTVAPTGALTDATCAWTSDGVDRSVEVTYVDWLGGGRGVALDVIDGCLIDSSVEPFERQR